MNKATDSSLSYAQRLDIRELIRQQLQLERTHTVSAISAVAEACKQVVGPISGSELYEIFRDLMTDIEGGVT